MREDIQQYRLNRSYNLNLETIDTLEKVSEQDGIFKNRVIEKIVKEWNELQDKESATTKKLSDDIQDVKESIAGISTRLYWIEGQIADAELITIKRDSGEQ